MIRNTRRLCVAAVAGSMLAGPAAVFIAPAAHAAPAADKRAATTIVLYA